MVTRCSPKWTHECQKYQLHHRSKWCPPPVPAFGPGITSTFWKVFSRFFWQFRVPWNTPSIPTQIFRRDACIEGLDPSAPLSVCTAQFCSRASFERRSIKHAAPSQAGGGYSSSILAIYNHSKGSATSEHPAGAGEQVPAAWLARAAALCRCVCPNAT